MGCRRRSPDPRLLRHRHQRRRLLTGDQRLRYVPETNWFGLDGFPYIIADASGARATGTVLIAVKPVNDAPSSSTSPIP
ncbi:MAG: cadherin-like domain-containing protein [Verrucomicrobia bacterium]|nr:cadherin-like domain-containing protein [Verrucomicrobiota bacterium]